MGRRLCPLAVALAGLLVPTQAAAQAPDGRPVVGGGSFNTAPLLKPGSYTDTIVTTGETTYYRVAIKKGQRLSASAVFDASGFETDPSSPGYVRGIGLVQYDVKIYSPLRQALIDDEDEQTGGADVKRESVRGKLALGYEDVLSNYTDDDFNGPGIYYLGVSTDPLFEDDETAAVQIPVSLRIDVGGRAQPSSRDYTGRLIPEGGAGSEDPPPAGEAPARLGGVDLASRGEDSVSAGLPWATVVALAVFALLGGLALGSLARLGRRAR